MISSDIIDACQKDGVTIQINENGDLRCEGFEQAVRNWLPKIREHKPDLVRLLSGLNDDTRTVQSVPADKPSRIRYMLDAFSL